MHIRCHQACVFEAIPASPPHETTSARRDVDHVALLVLGRCAKKVQDLLGENFSKGKCGRRDPFRRPLNLLGLVAVSLACRLPAVLRSGSSHPPSITGPHTIHRPCTQVMNPLVMLLFLILRISWLVTCSPWTHWSSSGSRNLQANPCICGRARGGCKPWISQGTCSRAVLRVASAALFVLAGQGGHRLRIPSSDTFS